ncbi:MAG: TIGR03086 family protein [Salinibacterium sp.]|nr:TIGR03086 family protein [Salinibacterium sp.]
MEYDWLSLQHRVQREFSRRIAAVTDWDAPTPDDEWNVRDLVAHVIEEQQWVPYLLAGETVATARKEIEPLRGDLREEWELYSFAATAAWMSTPPSTIVQLSYDSVTMTDYLREQVSDVAIHTWDLARAIGADEALDPEIVEAVWTVFEPQKDTLAASGLYAPPVPLPADAPLLHQLLAVTGRDPR